MGAKIMNNLKYAIATDVADYVNQDEIDLGESSSEYVNPDEIDLGGSEEMIGVM
jgi:hypothetical protein